MMRSAMEAGTTSPDSVTAFDQPNDRNDPAFGVAPGGQQLATAAGQASDILRQLALQKWQCVRSAYCDQFVQLAIYLWHTSRMAEDTDNSSNSNNPAAISNEQ